MKKLKLIKTACMAAALVFVAGTVGATQFTFQPLDGVGNRYDLNDLDHGFYYVWSIDNSASDALAAALNGNEEIVSATLTYYNIWDWRRESDNLATYLLEEPLSSTTTGGTWLSDNLWRKYDNSSPAIVPWSGQSALVANWDDPNGGSSTGFSLVYDFTPALLANLSDWAMDGDFGLGIDPDCHYYNDGVKLTIVTTPVPEPGSLLLVGAGLLGLGLIRRKKLFS